MKFISMVENKADIGPAGRFLGLDEDNISDYYEKNYIKMKGNIGFIRQENYFTGYSYNEFKPKY